MEWIWYISILYGNIYIIGYEDDPEAFIFTLKNPHGVKPTRFMKRKESDKAIVRDLKYGPIFGNGFDIYIGSLCNKEDGCSINSDGTHAYECHPQYKSSLFVETDQCDKKKMFSILDYEVYAIDYENKHYIYKACKYPDIIWNYVQTEDIIEEFLKLFDDDIEILKDMDALHRLDLPFRLKISRYYFKNPSQFLPNTQIVNQQYDEYLREWIGNKQVRLLYRASRFGYKIESFHECCDNYDHLLVVIKCIDGWIFGGYTSMSWKVNNPNNDGCIFVFLFINA